MATALSLPHGVVFAAALIVLTPACTGMVVGAAATGAVMALQERGLKGAAEDTAIRAAINHYWLQRDHEMYLRLSLQVWEGRVLVAGLLPDAEQRAEAIQLAWKADGVREVINEIEIATGRDIRDAAQDLLTEKEVSARLFVTRDIDSINYLVKVVDRTVFLIGTALDRDELDRVIAVIREVPKVRRIANYVLTRDDPRRFRAAPATS
ncbi:MAG: BON domain-containing protein [Alphaproteobacteria bacterium]|nr:BON domain-containing protein [Alphaproteobacteria bacterium]